MSKIDLISSHECEELRAVLCKLNAHAEIIPIYMGAVLQEKILNTDRFEMERAAQALAWLKKLRVETSPKQRVRYRAP